MDDARELELDGSEGSLYAAAWPHPDARYVAIVVHGYAEHIGRYAHVIERLAGRWGDGLRLDHLGHGRRRASERGHGGRARSTEDLGLLVTLARSENPGLPLVMIGHSMGGLVATRYAQTHPTELDALVLSGPVIGANPAIAALLELDPRSPRSRSTRRCCHATRRSARPTSRTRSSTTGRSSAETLRPCSRGGRPRGRGPKLRRRCRCCGSTAPRTRSSPRRGRRAIEHLRGEASEEKAYPGARHEIFNETNRDEVLDDVVAFINAQISS